MSHPRDYWVGPVIGEGAFAQVVYGRHKATNRKVAIKVVEQVTLQRNPGAMQGILTERNLLERLREVPYVVNLWASFYDKQCVYMVMELAQGGDLKGLIDRQQNDDLAAWRASIPHYVWQLYHAVSYLFSEHHIIHCDLKPGNILCTKTGELKLADFASAIDLQKKSPSQQYQQQQTQPHHNHNHHVVVPRGTSEYSPPELLRHNNNNEALLTNAVDIWSMGCIIYCMFCSHSPFHRDSEALTVRAVLDFAAAEKSDPKNTLLLLQKENEIINDCIPEEKWRQSILGLLQTDPSLRIKAWNELATTTSSSSSLLLQPEKPRDLVISKVAAWSEDVKGSKLRDGNMGWAAYLL